jgi:hypothetical protein
MVGEVVHVRLAADDVAGGPRGVVSAADERGGVTN